MSSDIARVHYFDRQYLRLDEFVDEQAYHLAAHRRHNIGHHIWGIVSGLGLTQDEFGAPIIAPGYAVDGFGRDLVLDAPTPVAVRAFDELESEEVAVWVVYDRFGSDRSPEGFRACDETALTTDFTREQERPRIVIDVPDPDTFDPRRPETVPEDDLAFPPYRNAPDDPRQDWPVFLGRITRDAGDPTQPTYTLDLKGRPYTGIVAATVEAPFEPGGPRLRLGGDEGTSDAEFQVLVPRTNGGNSTLEPALEIDAQADLRAHGNVEIRGDLAIDGGLLEFAAAGDTSQPVEGPQPWRIYRHRQSKFTEGDDLSEAPIGEQLRIEMASGAFGETTEVVIGAFSEDDGAFKPCLTIDSDCVVTVHGDLVVTGTLEESKKRVEAKLSRDARNLVLSSFQSGIAGSNLFLADRKKIFAGGGVLNSELPLGFQTHSGTPITPRSIAPETAPAMSAALIARFADDEAALGDLATTLRNADSGLAAKLAELLQREESEES